MAHTKWYIFPLQGQNMYIYHGESRINLFSSASDHMQEMAILINNVIHLLSLQTHCSWCLQILLPLHHHPCYLMMSVYLNCNGCLYPPIMMMSSLVPVGPKDYRQHECCRNNWRRNYSIWRFQYYATKAY